MALGAEGSALDCFEVKLKSEDDEEDDDEAVVVAVIPRPEPRLGGEDEPHSCVVVWLRGADPSHPPPPGSRCVC